MAEVKNAFIKSKMNKDLDSRLLPSGEYRDGRNIQVSKSEGEDVGALENAVGNLPAETTSGANDVDNVDLVQVFDTHQQTCVNQSNHPTAQTSAKQVDSSRQ